MSVEVKLPDLGDGVDSGDILEILVSEGDVIQKEQGLVEVETEKATVEVPSTHTGVVTKVLVKAGQTVATGDVLVSLEPGTTSPEPSESVGGAEQAPKTAAAEAVVKSVDPSGPPAETPVLQSKIDMPAPHEHSSVSVPSVSKSTAVPSAPLETKKVAVVPAGPAIRRFAREVGVDLATVPGTGSGGRITRDDVLQAVRNASRQAIAEVRDSSNDSEVKSKPIATPPSTPGKVTTDNWGSVTVEKMTKIRQTIATKMHESWSTVPRVTNFDDADVTELEVIRQASKSDYADAGIKLTSMPFVIKAVGMALRQHPLVNAALDMENRQIHYKQYINVGVAVDTDRGLVVPVLRNADNLSVAGVARELATIADNVRSGEFSLSDLCGGTFTISNLGAIGGTYSTPIVNVPEVAILLVGRSRKMPIVVKDKVTIRLMMPLSLSYDHRLIDGGTAARFLNDVIAYLAAPGRLLLAP